MAEHPTPHSIAISTLLFIYSDPNSSLHKYKSGVLSACLLQDLLHSDGHISCATPTSVPFHTESLSSLLDRIDRIFHHECDELRRSGASLDLLSRLTHAAGGIENLLGLFDSFRSLLLHRYRHEESIIGIDGDSVFGVYLRRVCLGMDDLDFDVLSRLWVALGKYVKEETEAEVVNEMDGMNMVIDKDSGWMPSSLQVERTTKYTCHHFYQYQPPPPQQQQQPHQNTRELSRPFCNLLDTHPEVPSLHFLLYLTSLSNQDRSQTLESLHRYFDYAMIHERRERAERSMIQANSTDGTTAGREVSRAETNVVQYAPILLAMTYHRFGCDDLCSAATEEAMRVAQRSGDEECVEFARGWMAAVGGDNSMLRQCRSGAVERGLSSLAVGVSLELGRREGYLRSGTFDTPLEGEGRHSSLSAAWNSIQSAGRVSSSLSGGRRGFIMGGSNGTTAVRAGLGGQTFADIYSMTSTKVLTTSGRRNLAISGLWDSTGHTLQGALSSYAALYGFGSKMRPEDISSAMRRVLASFSYGPGLDVWESDVVGEFGDMTKGGSCVYLAALIRLMQIQGTGLDSEWVQSTAAILHEWSVRLYDWKVARALEFVFADYAAFSSPSYTSFEAKLVYQSRKSHMHFQERDFVRAKEATRHAYQVATENSVLIHKGWQLLRLALIELEESTSSSSNNPFVQHALPSLLECLHLSDQHAMDPLSALAMTTLAKILLHMGRFRNARAMLNAAMPLVMQHGHIWFQAEACSTMANCYLAEARLMETRTGATNSKTNGNKSGMRTRASSASVQCRRDLLHRALSCLESATSLYKKIDDIHRLRRMYYIRAIVCNEIPEMKATRDDCARKFSHWSKKRHGCSESRKVGDFFCAMMLCSQGSE